MWSSHLIFGSVLIINIHPFVLGHLSDVGWLSICHGGINVSGTDCVLGTYWFAQEIELPDGCVCVKGVWALTSQACDSDALILAGNGDCFKVTKKIRKLTKLGDNLTTSISLVSSEWKKFVFQSLDQEPIVVANKSLVIVRINPSKELFYTSKSGLLCIDESRNVSRTIIEKYLPSIISPEGPSVSVIKILRSPSMIKLTELSASEVLANTCEVQTKMVLDAFEAQNLKLHRGHGLFVATEKIISTSFSCADACGTSSSLARSKRDNSDEDIQVQGFFGMSVDKTPGEMRDAFMPNVKAINLAEQNVKMIKAELSFLKDWRKNEELQIPDRTFDFIRMSRHILNYVCPLEDVPVLMTKSITRLFKYLTSDRREENQYGTMDVKNRSYEKILDILGRCYNESEPFQFVYSVAVKDCVDQDEGKPTKKPKIRTTTTTTAAPEEGKPDEPDEEDEEAPAQSNAGICTCYKNYTGVRLNDTVNNTCTEDLIDPGNAWEYDEETDRDFVIETMWKIFQFTFYQCSQYFINDGMDASVFHTTVERYFSADVIFRWVMGGQNSRKVWEYFFMGYDIPSFVRGMDTCLCAAQKWSVYPRPMARPTVPTLKRKKRESLRAGVPKFLSTQALRPPKCLTHAWDPVQFSNSQHKC